MLSTSSTHGERTSGLQLGWVHPYRVSLDYSFNGTVWESKHFPGSTFSFTLNGPSIQTPQSGGQTYSNHYPLPSASSSSYLSYGQRKIVQGCNSREHGRGKPATKEALSVWPHHTMYSFQALVFFLWHWGWKQDLELWREAPCPPLLDQCLAAVLAVAQAKASFLLCSVSLRSLLVWSGLRGLPSLSVHF